MALLSAGCGEDDDKKQTSAKLAGSITVAAAGGEGEIKALQGVADEFMVDNPGTTVTLDTVEGAGDLISKLTTAFAAQSAPDVFVLNYRRLGGFAASGVIEPVPSGGTEGMYDEPLEAFTFDGKLLCRPSNASSMVVYYNTKLFAQAGVDVPDADWTWDDLKSTATALKAKGVSSIGFETALIRLAPFVWSNGGEIVDDADKRRRRSSSCSTCRRPGCRPRTGPRRTRRQRSRPARSRCTWTAVARSPGSARPRGWPSTSHRSRRRRSRSRCSTPTATA